MEDETKKEPTEEVDYVQAIQELKATTVPKEQYAKLKAENSRLLQSILNGEELETSESEKPDIAELRKELYSGETHLTNIEIAQKTLQLRQAIIDAGGTDPALPHGSKVIPDQNDIECAERVASVIQECIDFADGDNGVFTAELQRRMVDIAPSKKR